MAPPVVEKLSISKRSELASLAESPLSSPDLAGGKGKLSGFGSTATSSGGRKTSRESRGRSSSETTPFGCGFSTGKVKPSVKGTLTVVVTIGNL